MNEYINLQAGNNVKFAQSGENLQINADNQIIDLLAVTDTAPSECSTGDKYFNTTNNQIYTATAQNTWSETGETPIKNIMYIVYDQQSSYSWNGTNLVIVGESSRAELAAVYPIGSIYMSVNNVNPATLFGFGTWEQIKDRFLLSSGNTYIAGNTGGNSSVNYTPAGSVGNHTLTVNEIPNHNHSVQFVEWKQDGFWVGNGSYTQLGFVNKNTSSVGGGQGHNHGFTGTQATINTMPPYLVVYMWKRTA